MGKQSKRWTTYLWFRLQRTLRVHGAGDERLDDLLVVFGYALQQLLAKSVVRQHVFDFSRTTVDVRTQSCDGRGFWMPEPTPYIFPARQHVPTLTKAESAGKHRLNARL